MKVTKRTLVLMSCALAACIAATILLLFAGRGSGGTAEESIYYFTNYDSAEMLMAASVENESGSAVLAQAGGSFYAVSDQDVAGDADAVQAFFESACRLPLLQMLEGASAADEQYGLTSPRATVVLQDVRGDGVLIYIGGQVPGGEGVYTCLGGDDRVFIMENSRAELFLSNVNRFFDLTLYPSLSDGGLKQLTAIQAERDGAVSYRLEQVAYSSDSELAYFALTVPFRLLLRSDQLNNQVLAPLTALEGIRLVTEPEELAAYGLTDSAPRLRLTYEDGSTATLRIGDEVEGETYVLAEERNMLVTVPAAEISLVYDTPMDIVGQRPAALNLNVISSLSVGGRTFALEGTGQNMAVTINGEPGDLDRFQSTVLRALHALTLQGTYKGPLGSRLLEADIRTRLAGEQILLEFYELDSRQCAVRVNGKTAFWCDAVAVEQLLTAVENAA